MPTAKKSDHHLTSQDALQISMVSWFGSLVLLHFAGLPTDFIFVLFMTGWPVIGVVWIVLLCVFWLLKK